MRNKNIILAGFMGSGKTSVGLKLSRRLQMRFIDIDVEIERSEGMTINDIFEKKGESYFREIESKVTKKVSRFENAVIATGGGSLLNPASYESLKTSGVIIWLKADLETIKARLGDNVERPLLNGSGDIDELYSRRQSIYEESGIKIDTDYLSIDAIADEICMMLGIVY